MTISTFTSVRPYGGVTVSWRSTSEFPIPAVVSKNGNDKSCLVCVKSEKYAFLVTLRPLWSMREGEASYIHNTALGEEKQSYVY